MTRTARAAVVVALLLLGNVAAPRAAAHASLDACAPAERSRVPESPAAVRLEFTEDVSAARDSLRVFDTHGTRVDTELLVAEGRTVVVGLRPGLPQGPYVVSWSVVARDSHPLGGAYTFTVGAGPIADATTVARLGGPPPTKAWDVAAVVARTVGYAGVLLAAGGSLFLAVVHDRPTANRRLLDAVRRAATLGAVGVLVDLGLTATQASPSSDRWGFDRDFLSAVVADGGGLRLALTLSGLALVVVGTTARRGIDRIAVGIGGMTAVSSFAATGHSTTAEPAWRSALLDVVHVAAAAAWFGGLVLLLLVIRSSRRNDTPALAGRVLGRFSALAAMSVIVLASSGVALAWGQVGSLEALTSTRYGHLLMAKVALALLLATIGFYNRTVLVREIEAQPATSAAWRLLRHAVAVEAAVFVAAIVVTSTLVVVVPAVMSTQA